MVRRWIVEGRFRLCDAATIPDLPPILAASLFSRLFGFSQILLRSLTVLWALLGVFFLDALLKEFDAPPARRGIACAALFFNPLFFILAFSFHSDVPFAVLVLASAFFFVKAEKTGEANWLLGTSLAAGAAALTRQTGLLSLIGCGAWLLVRKERRPRPWAALILPAALLMGGGAYWFYAVHGPTWGSVSLTQREVFRGVADAAAYAFSTFSRMADTIFYGALFCAPLALAAAPRRPFLWNREAAVKAAAVLLIAGYLLSKGGFPLFPNVFHRKGLGVLTGHGISEWKAAGFWGSPFLWGGMSFLSAFFMVELGGTFSRPWPRLEAALLFASCPLAFCLVKPSGFFDRYIVAALPGFLALAVPRFSGGKTGRWAWVLVACWAALSLVGARDYFAWNRAKWSLGLRAANFGVPPERVANGTDWNAYWNYDRNIDALKGKKALRDIGDWEWLWMADRDMAAVVSHAPDFPGGRALDEETYFSPLAPHGGKLTLFGLTAPAPPRPSPAEKKTRRAAAPLPS